MQVITASRPEWVLPFTGLQPVQFRRLVRLVAERGGDAIADGRPGRQWSLDLADRVLPVAAYWRTNLTMRQIGPLSGVSHSAVHRVIDTLGPLLALAPVHRRRVDQVTIVDGTLVYRTSGIDAELTGRPVMADGAYRGNPDVIIPCRKPADGRALPDWKKSLNRHHRSVRAQVEHALAGMRTYQILRDYRRARTLTNAASGIAHLNNIILLE
ncbi:transposase family protein [Micromonospora sp. DT229]|uniref:transposase family protein n=1 Tax=Micromonospora sp. DT229 TaxID=3393430 RepID=UPI003CFB75EB